MMDPAGSEAATIPFFKNNRKDCFFDLLDQVRLVSDKKDEFGKWLESKKFIAWTDEKRKIDYEKWLKKLDIKPGKNEK